jgi:hypothetical protein
MAVLDRAAIIAAQDLRRELVAVPEWGGEVYIRVMTSAEKDKLDEANNLDGKLRWEGYRARLLAATICDGDGKLLFGLAEASELMGKSAAAVDRLLDVAQRLNGVTKADVEGLAKN